MKNLINSLLLVVFAIVSFFIAESSWAFEEPKQDDMLVILIGINNYTENTICDLSGAEDVRLALTDWLIPYSKTDNRVTVWVASDKMDDLAQKHRNLVEKCMLPIKANILQLLKEAENANYDRLIVSFSGHGVCINNTSYLAPQEASLKDVSSFVSLEEVFTQLNKSKIKNKLLVLDTSFPMFKIPDKGGIPVRANSSKDEFIPELEMMKKNSKDYSFDVITSCSKGEQAQEFPLRNISNGLFSWYFIKGLTGKADMVFSYDGKINLVEAYNYARSKTYKLSVVSNYLDTQTPELFHNNTDNFILSSGNWVKETESEIQWYLLYRTAVTLAKQEDSVQQQNQDDFSELFISNKAIEILSGLHEIKPSNKFFSPF